MEELTPEEKKKLRQKEYYKSNREKILRQRKEYRKRPGIVEKQKEYLLRHYQRKLAKMQQEE